MVILGFGVWGRVVVPFDTGAVSADNPAVGEMLRCIVEHVLDAVADMVAPAVIVVPVTVAVKVAGVF